MRNKLKKIVIPIFVAVFCGFLCGRLMFGIYEDKGSDTINSNVIYLLMDTTYESYDEMKVNTISSNYIYYEDEGKYNVVVGMTRNRDNIEKIEKIYNKKLEVSSYLINDEDIINKINEYDDEMFKSNDENRIKDIIKSMIMLYKGKDDIKLVKIG